MSCRFKQEKARLSSYVHPAFVPDLDLNHDVDKRRKYYVERHERYAPSCEDAGRP